MSSQYFVNSELKFVARCSKEGKRLPQDYFEIASFTSFTRNDKPACVCPHADKRGTNTCKGREEKRGLLLHSDAFG